MRAYIGAAVQSPAPPERVFAVLTDWPRHGEWMVLTAARVTEGDGRSVGSRLEAFSGWGRLGFLDTMVITRWEPPERVEVLHTGRVVRGRGAIRVRPLPGGGSRVVWAEELRLPLGPVGRAAWALVRPVMRVLLVRSLRTLARLASG
ncbi:SRPBCC family protein [Thermoactinospora rubra]|uniref:SRPBCC family protein n=1 Tax=Thermoactinospora rubra TaxID=1088767 RepID=UPI001980FC04|nr:SRPBCC family protein [Thermoactinospora rubra]